MERLETLGEKKNRKRVNDVGDGDRWDPLSAMLDQLWDIAAEDAAEQIRASRVLNPEEELDDVKVLPRPVLRNNRNDV